MGINCEFESKDEFLIFSNSEKKPIDNASYKDKKRFSILINAKWEIEMFNTIVKNLVAQEINKKHSKKTAQIPNVYIIT